MSTDDGYGDQFDPERKTDAERLSAAAEAHYRTTWNVRNCVHVEHCAGIYDNYAAAKGVIEVLDYTSIDTIIDTYDAQYAIHERWIMPDAPGDRFALRLDTGTSVSAEADTIRAIITNPRQLTPGVAAYGKATRSNDFGWFVIVDLVAFAEKWVTDGAIHPVKVWHGQDGTGALLFDTADLAAEGVLIDTYGTHPDLTSVSTGADAGVDVGVGVSTGSGGDVGASGPTPHLDEPSPDEYAVTGGEDR